MSYLIWALILVPTLWLGFTTFTWLVLWRAYFPRDPFNWRAWISPRLYGNWLLRHTAERARQLFEERWKAGRVVILDDGSRVITNAGLHELIIDPDVIADYIDPESVE